MSVYLMGGFKGNNTLWEWSD